MNCSKIIEAAAGFKILGWLFSNEWEKLPNRDGAVGVFQNMKTSACGAAVLGGTITLPPITIHDKMICYLYSMLKP